MGVGTIKYDLVEHVLWDMARQNIIGETVEDHILKYFHVELSSMDSEKTRFTSHHELFLSTCMLFELKTRWTIQSAMNAIQFAVKGYFVLVVLHDIVMFSHKEAYKERCTRIDVITQSNVILKLIRRKKCAFFIEQHVLSIRCSPGDIAFS